MSPTRFRERGLHETIRFATAPCELGLLLVAATERGVCSVMLGDEPAALERLLRQQFRAANIVPDATGMRGAGGGHSRRDDAIIRRPGTFRWMCGQPHSRRGSGRLCGRSPAARRAAMRNWQGYRSTDCGAGRGPGLRHQPGRHSRSMPPRDRQRRLADRLPLGRGAEEEAVGNGEQPGKVCALSPQLLLNGAIAHLIMRLLILRKRQGSSIVFGPVRSGNVSTRPIPFDFSSLVTGRQHGLEKRRFGFLVHNRGVHVSEAGLAQQQLQFHFAETQPDVGV